MLKHLAWNKGKVLDELLELETELKEQKYLTTLELEHVQKAIKVITDGMDNYSSSEQ